MKLKNSLPICRIVLSISIFLLFSTAPLTAANRVIETSKGQKNVTIPEGMTLEDAFLRVSVLYLEEKWDHEDLIISSEDLLLDIKSYKDSISVLQDLNKTVQDQKDDLVILYEEKTKRAFITPKLGFGAEIDLNNNLSFDLLIGASIFEKIDIYTKIGYPLSFGVQIGVSL